MVATTCLFVPTTRAVQIGDFGDHLAEHAEFLETVWNDSIAAGQPQYEIRVDSTADLEVPISGRQIETALSRARRYIDEETSLHDRYHSVLVFDTFLYRYHGMAYIGTAGGPYGVGMIGLPLFKRTSAHEVGHLYGGNHAGRPDSSSTRWDSTFQLGSRGEASLMNSRLDYSCGGNRSFHWTGSWFSECTIDRVRTYIDEHIAGDGSD